MAILLKHRSFMSISKQAAAVRVENKNARARENFIFNCGKMFFLYIESLTLSKY